MIATVILGTVALVSLLIMHLCQQRQIDRLIDHFSAQQALTLEQAVAERDRLAVERKALADRIQAPDRLPMPPVNFEFPHELEPDEIDMVGTIAEPGEES